MGEGGGRWRRLVVAVRSSDDDAVETALLDLSRRHRLLAPLSLLVGGFAVLFQGVRLLVTNWRLTLIQILPALLIWGAMLDLKVHAFKGQSFNVVQGPVLIPVLLALGALTAAAYLLNAVFAFAVSGGGAATWSSAFDRAWRHRRVILGWGFVIGLALGFAVAISSRWGRGWFGVCLGVVVAVMMVTYVAVPAGLVGIRTVRTRRDQVTTAAVSGAMSAILCSPPYILGRSGIVLLGTSHFFVVGLVLLVVAVPLQAGAVTATKAVKFSSKLLAGAGSGTSDPERDPSMSAPEPALGPVPVEAQGEPRS